MTALDRAARALLDEQRRYVLHQEPLTDEQWAAVSAQRGMLHFRHLFDCARAVLAALDPPTPDMAMAGGNVSQSNLGPRGDRRGRRIGDQAARECWRAMLAAAREGK